MAHLAVTELIGERGYTSVSLFAPRSILEVAFSGTGPQVYWGLGLWPWVGAIAAGALLIAGLWTRISVLSPGRLLIAGWAVWSVIFAWFAARGAIPTQLRTYVLLHLLGALALAVAADEILRDRQWGHRLIMAGATVSLLVALITSAEARAQWRAEYPSDVATVTRFLSDAGNEDGILTDWMWWREWTVGVYATPPGGRVCNYHLCTSGGESKPPVALTTGLTEPEERRLTQAWQFVVAGPPRFITMFNDDTYAEWRAWEAATGGEVLSSFVRPLLRSSGDCFRTTAGLPPTTYCPVLRSGRYVILEAISGIG